MNPQLAKIRRRFDGAHIEDVEGAVRDQMERCPVDWAPGSSIAITAGSRGVANIALILRAVAGFLREKGVRPFIVPAMGSHGGATAEGQAALLAGYGVTGEYIGAPVRSSMEVVELPRGKSDVGVYMDRLAWESDGVVAVGRIKPHTDFHGPVESGLLKMLVIGLGKHRQALAAHTFGAPGLRRLIPVIAREVIASGKIRMGLGIVENAYDQTMAVEAIPAADIERRERELLDLSRAHMPSLPVDRLDILLIDRIGKEISGAGMDTNIIGRIGIHGETDPETPDIATIIAADLSDATHGNAAGVGLADIITRRLYDKIDFHATYENTLTSTFLRRACIPMTAKTDAEAVGFALRVNQRAIPALRMARIQSTLRLDELYVSPAVLEELRGREDIEVLSQPAPLLDGDDFTPFG